MQGSVPKCGPHTARRKFAHPTAGEVMCDVFKPHRDSPEARLGKRMMYKYQRMRLPVCDSTRKWHTMVAYERGPNSQITPKKIICASNKWRLLDGGDSMFGRNKEYIPTQGTLYDIDTVAPNNTWGNYFRNTAIDNAWKIGAGIAAVPFAYKYMTDQTYKMERDEARSELQKMAEKAKSLEKEREKLNKKLVKSEAEEARLKEINDELNVKLERARAELEQVKAQLALKIEEAEELVRKNSINEAAKADLREKLEEAKKEKNKSTSILGKLGYAAAGVVAGAALVGAGAGLTVVGTASAALAGLTIAVGYAGTQLLAAGSMMGAAATTAGTAMGTAATTAGAAMGTAATTAGSAIAANAVPISTAALGAAGMHMMHKYA